MAVDQKTYFPSQTMASLQYFPKGPLQEQPEHIACTRKGTPSIYTHQY